MWSAVSRRKYSKTPFYGRLFSLVRFKRGGYPLPEGFSWSSGGLALAELHENYTMWCSETRQYSEHLDSIKMRCSALENLAEHNTNNDHANNRGIHSDNLSVVSDQERLYIPHPRPFLENSQYIRCNEGFLLVFCLYKGKTSTSRKDEGL